MSEISIKELQARLRAAADTTDEQSLIVQSCAAIEALRAERDALAAKLAEMEGQEPVVWQHRNGMLSCRRPACRAIIAAESEASPAYGPDNPPRLRRPDESVEAYREAMGWPTIQPQAKGD